MTLIDEGVRLKLVATTSAVYALIGARVFYDEVPLGETLPAITLHKISDIPDPQVPGAHKARVQCSCWDDPPRDMNGVRSPSAVERLASAVGSIFHKPRVGFTPERWEIGSTVYSITKSEVADAPRLIEDKTRWLHVPADVLLEFREV